VTSLWQANRLHRTMGFGWLVRLVSFFSEAAGAEPKMDVVRGADIWSRRRAGGTVDRLRSGKLGVCRDGFVCFSFLTFPSLFVSVSVSFCL
jgi:hypothetical protein